ncbi:MAG: MBL fold metallo-hydrolase [Candidatus Woesearchaeota archaeon]
MAEVKILFQGYCSKDCKGHACSTIVLVRDKDNDDKDINMVVDPGTLSDPNILEKELAKNGLKLEDIDIVCITHSHIDHYRNIGMFRKAKSLDYWGYWDGDLWKECDGIITKDVKIIKTPGHSDDSITLLVNTNIGIIAICGDVFWKEDHPKKDNYANNMKQLIKSREKLIEISDYIIPGHGKMFKAKKLI